MTRVALAFSENVWSQLRSWLNEPDEVAGVLIVSVIDDPQGTTLLAREVERAPEESYVDRRPDGMSLRSSGWVHAVRRARGEATMAMFVHTHPLGYPVFSRWDDRVDEELRPAFLDLARSDLYGSLVIAGGPGGFAGRVWRRDGPVVDISAVRVVGDRLTIHRSFDDLVRLPDVHDRQARAFGEAGQRVLAGLSVGVVGVGGTGSPVVEQLARLGVGSLVLIDDDVVTPSSVARGYGSTIHDIGRPKVDVAADNVARIGLDTVVRAVRGNLRSRETVAELAHCDAVFCCVDGHAARLILNRWAYWHLAPVIDMAVLVASSEGIIDGIHGRVTWLSPGAACLLCRGRIDAQLANVEHLQPGERRRLAEQGYVPELGEPEPSVVTYTSLLASLSTTELLNRLFGLADTASTEMVLQLHTRSSSLNRRPPREGCFCSSPERWGLGVAEPYLDLTWTG